MSITAGLRPNFIGLGAPKTATTWLHAQLIAHPQAFVPAYRKELYFFNREYARGESWYLDFFRTEKNTAAIRAIGEITPNYMFSSDALTRIKAFGVERVIIMLRNPIDRSYSSYHHLKRFREDLPSFEQMIDADDLQVVQHSRYASGLRKSFDLFGHENVLILLHEDVAHDSRTVLDRVASFLQLDPVLFNASLMQKPINAGFVPKFPWVVRSLYLLNKNMRKLGMDRLVERFKTAGGKRLLKALGRKAEPMSRETRQRLATLFSSEVAELRDLRALDNSMWALDFPPSKRSL